MKVRDIVARQRDDALRDEAVEVRAEDKQAHVTGGRVVLDVEGIPAGHTAEVLGFARRGIVRGPGDVRWWTVELSGVGVTAPDGSRVLEVRETDMFPVG